MNRPLEDKKMRWNKHSSQIALVKREFEQSQIAGYTMVKDGAVVEQWDPTLESVLATIEPEKHVKAPKAKPAAKAKGKAFGIEKKKEAKKDGKAKPE